MAGVLGEENLQLFEDHGFVLPYSFNEEENLRQIREKELQGVSLNILYLILSESCNLACRYCFFEDGMPNDRSKMMSVETANRALGLFAGWADREHKSTIILYGGDPLINEETLRSVVSKVKAMIDAGDLPEGSSLSLITNGVLMKPDLVDFLARYQGVVNVSISMDGCPEINDQFRVDRSGRGSYNRALNGYMCLKDGGLNPAISCTLTPVSLDRLDEIINWIIGLEPSGVGFNTIVDVPGVEMDESYAQRVAQALISAFIRLREAGIYEDRMMRKIKAFVEGKRYLRDCGGYGGQLVVASNGDLGICHGYTATREHFRANLYSLGDFDPRNDPDFLTWSNRSPISLSGCYNCPAVGICGGGCAYNAKQRHSDLWAVDDQFCPHARLTLAWMIKELYDQD